MALGRTINFEDNDKNLEPKKIGRPINLENKQISRLRSLISAFPKGLIKGSRGSNPLTASSPIPQKLAKRLLEELLPTQDKATENVLEKTGEILPQAIIGKGPGSLLGSLGRSAAAAATSEAVKAAGGNEFLQAGAEVAAFGLPGLGRKILPTKSQEKLVNFARKAGMTEKQIAPLMPQKGKKAFFGKIASKGEKTQKALSDTKKGISDAYEFVKNSSDASKKLSPQQSHEFTDKIYEINRSMPSEIRKQVSDDYLDLINDGLTGKNLINFYQDISSRYKMGREHLERLKQPIKEALENISPTLSEDFQLTNELFKKRLSIGKTLKPNISSELMDLGELGKFAHDIINFSLKGVSQIVGISAARRFSREMLTNPRLQNITRQMAKAANENKIPVVLELARYIKDRFSEESVEHAK